MLYLGTWSKLVEADEPGILFPALPGKAPKMLVPNVDPLKIHHHRVYALGRIRPDRLTASVPSCGVIDDEMR